MEDVKWQMDSLTFSILPFPFSIFHFPLINVLPAVDAVVCAGDKAGFFAG
jgi:hypothetical protein